jgi:peptidoglycan hydrolase-like protein with peptidoglycan-binding domain
MKYSAFGVLLGLVAAVLPLQTSAYYVGAAQSVQGPCVSLSRTLSRGMRGSDVTDLQRFMVAQNYQGGGSWMVTGYYGLATETAVRNFQTERGLVVNGIVDEATRAAIGSACSSWSYGTVPVQPISTPVYYQPQPVTNYYYPAQPQYNYTTPVAVVGTPVVYSLSKTAGNVGETITIYGANFSAEGNTVHFGRGIIANLRSLDTTTLSFTVPSQLIGYGTEPTALATYAISVTNKDGRTSTSVPFTVTGLTNATTAPGISVNGPSTLSQNVQGSWAVTVTTSGNNYLSTTVTWGDESYTGAAPETRSTYYGQQQINFTHLYRQAGTYTITFRVKNLAGVESVTSTTVTVTGVAGTLALNSLSPTSGRVGTTITLNGSGFTNDNIVHFGVGGSQLVPSYSGSAISYVVPQYLSPCSVTPSGSICTQNIQAVTPGSYPMYVQNGNGTTQTLTFAVTQ